MLNVYKKQCQLFSYSVFNTCQKVNTAVHAYNFLDRLQFLHVGIEYKYEKIIK